LAHLANRRKSHWLWSANTGKTLPYLGKYRMALEGLFAQNVLVKENRSFGKLWFRVVVVLVMCASASFSQSPTPASPAADAPVSNNPPSTQPPSSTASPQSEQPPAIEDPNVFVFKKKVEEVVLHATVDQGGKPVSDLEATAFTLYDNGAPQKITSFRREDIPVALGILVDNSGSMLDKRPQLSKAVLNLVQASNARDEVFVVNFGQYPYLDQDFTSDVGLLQNALLHVSSAGSTALYDAVVSSTVHISNNPREDKKILLIITDGQDNMSVDTLQGAIQSLQQKDGPIVYAIGLAGDGLSDAGRSALISLTRATGGMAFFPLNITEVDSITRQIARDIRVQYDLSYKPANRNTQNNAFRTLKVVANSPTYGPLNVRTRTGYYPNQVPH
jgi:VWFA-related protein